jgi:hypothetical protein
MIKARIFDGFVSSIMEVSPKISAWKIISHRGKLAHSGEKIDMHEPARQFVSRYLADVQNQNFKGLELVETLEEKIQRINDFEPFLIVDDLSKVLEHEKLSSSIIRMQFMAGGFNDLHTIKGKGVSFMERASKRHHRRFRDGEYEAAMEELSLEQVNLLIFQIT